MGWAGRSEGDFPPAGSLPQWLPWPGLVQAEASRLELHPGLPRWWQVLKHVGHLLLLSQVQGAGLEAEKPGLELALTGEPALPGAA